MQNLGTAHNKKIICHYEALRESRFKKESFYNKGTVLFLHQGMVALIKQYIMSQDLHNDSNCKNRNESNVRLSIPTSLQNDAVSLLANMTINLLEKEIR